MKNYALAALAASLSLTVALPANGAVISVNSAAALGQTDVISWSQLGKEFATFSSPQSFTSVGGLVGTISDSNNPFERRDQSTSWFGNFAPLAPLIYNGGSGTITLTFAEAIRGAGSQIQSAGYGAFTGSIAVNGGALGIYNFSGTSTGNSNNSAIFFGVLSDVANITSITYTMTTPYASFAIGQASLNRPASVTAAVPEPATWAMMIVGFGLVGSAMRRRSTKIAFA